LIKDKVKTSQEVRLEDHLKKQFIKRDQLQQFNSVQADSSRDVDIDSSVQTANNTNIHFQTHNSVVARSFVGIYLNIKYILNLKFF